MENWIDALLIIGLLIGIVILIHLLKWTFEGVVDTLRMYGLLKDSHSQKSYIRSQIKNLRSISDPEEQSEYAARKISEATNITNRALRNSRIQGWGEVFILHINQNKPLDDTKRVGFVTLENDLKCLCNFSSGKDNEFAERFRNSINSGRIKVLGLPRWCEFV